MEGRVKKIMIKLRTSYSDSCTTTFPSSSIDTLPFGDKSVFATSMGSNRGGRGGQGRDQGSRGRGCGLRECTYCHGENHMVDFCWELCGKPSTYQANFQVKKPPSQSLPPISRVVFILEEEYNRLLSMHSNFIRSNPTATLAQLGTSIYDFETWTI